jgi:hypothetical protein
MRLLKYSILIIAFVSLIMVLYTLLKKKRKAAQNEKEIVPQILGVTTTRGITSAVVSNAKELIDEVAKVRLDLSGDTVSYTNANGEKKHLQTISLKTIGIHCSEIAEELNLANFGFPDFTLINSPSSPIADSSNVRHYILYLAKKGVAGEYIRIKEYDSLPMSDCPQPVKIAN